MIQTLLQPNPKIHRLKTSFHNLVNTPTQNLLKKIWTLQSKTQSIYFSTTISLMSKIKKTKSILKLNKLSQSLQTFLKI